MPVYVMTIAKAVAQSVGKTLGKPGAKLKPHAAPHRNQFLPRHRRRVEKRPAHRSGQPLPVHLARRSSTAPAS